MVVVCGGGHGGRDAPGQSPMTTAGQWRAWKKGRVSNSGSYGGAPEETGHRGWEGMEGRRWRESKVRKIPLPRRNALVSEEMDEETHSQAIPVCALQLSEISQLTKQYSARHRRSAVGAHL